MRSASVVETSRFARPPATCANVSGDAGGGGQGCIEESGLEIQPAALKELVRQYFYFCICNGKAVKEHKCCRTKVQVQYSSTRAQMVTRSSELLQVSFGMGDAWIRSTACTLDTDPQL